MPSVGFPSTWALGRTIISKIMKKHQNTVLLVSYLPPPMGGIATWTAIIMQQAAFYPDMKVVLVDIAARWRLLHQREIWRRALGGGRQLVRDFFLTWKLIRKERPASLHLCTPAQLALVRDISFLLLAGAHGMKRIYHLRFGRLAELAEKRNWEWCLIAIAITLADIVVVLDKATLWTIQQQFPTKAVTQIPNCLDPASLELGGANLTAILSPKNPRAPRLVYVGWILPTKGVLELVQAAREVEGSAFELEIVGPGSPAYINEIRSAGRPLGARLILRGELPHEVAIESIRKADILVLPSYAEGFPNVILEAMALAKPVIATNVGAISEMLSEGSARPCGITVPPRDIPALVNAIRSMLKDERLRQLMGMNAYQRFQENYSAETVMSNLRQLWVSFPEVGLDA